MPPSMIFCCLYLCRSLSDLSFWSRDIILLKDTRNNKEHGKDEGQNAPNLQVGKSTNVSNSDDRCV